MDSQDKLIIKILIHFTAKGEEIAIKPINAIPFSLKGKSVTLDKRIITFDIESSTTAKDDVRMVVPYLVSLYNGPC